MQQSYSQGSVQNPMVPQDKRPVAFYKPEDNPMQQLYSQGSTQNPPTSQAKRVVTFFEEVDEPMQQPYSQESTQNPPESQAKQQPYSQESAENLPAPQGKRDVDCYGLWGNQKGYPYITIDQIYDPSVNKETMIALQNKCNNIIEATIDDLTMRTLDKLQEKDSRIIELEKRLNKSLKPEILKSYSVSVDMLRGKLLYNVEKNDGSPRGYVEFANYYVKQVCILKYHELYNRKDDILLTFNDDRMLIVPFDALVPTRIVNLMNQNGFNFLLNKSDDVVGESIYSVFIAIFKISACIEYIV